MNSSWNKDWLEIQRQFMSALTSASKAEHKHSGQSSTDWQAMMTQWWQSQLFGSTGDPQAIFSHLAEDNNDWQSLSGKFTELMHAVAASGKEQADWQAVLNAHISAIKTHMEDAMKAQADSFWQSLETVSAADTEALLAPWLPAGAAGRQQFQQGLQEGIRLWQRCMDNCRAYREQMNKIDLLSLDSLEETILRLAEKGKSIESLRDLYDIWVDSHEDTYTQYVLTEEYSRLYGEVINSLLQYRAHGQDFTSEMFKVMNIPSGKQQDALLAQLQGMKRTQQADKEKIRVLEERLLKLEAETGAAAPGRKKRATGKKKTAKKKTTTKNKPRRSKPAANKE